MSLHLITSHPDGQLSSTPLTIATEINDVWIADIVVADVHCQSKTRSAEYGLAHARTHLNRYVRDGENDTNTHCRNRENSGVTNVNLYTDGKKSWVNQQLISRMKKWTP